MTLPGTTTPSQSEYGSNGNEEVLPIPQSSLYPGPSLKGLSFLSVEMLSVYSKTTADWTKVIIFIIYKLFTYGYMEVNMKINPTVWRKYSKNKIIQN